MLARAQFGARVMQNFYKFTRMLQKCRSGRTNRFYIYIYITIYSQLASHDFSFVKTTKTKNCVNYALLASFEQASLV